MSTITKEQAQKIIEAADEVITALAGTNEDVHPESDSMLRLWDDLNDRYAPPEVVRELARIALASLEAEPVAWRYRHHNGLAPSNWRFVDIEVECNKASNYQRQAVYTVPPVPVVPDKRSPRDMEMLLDDTGAEVAGQDLELVLALMSTTWNVCRHAMLQSADGNSPVIPDGWVACSERMPSIGVPVITCCGDVVQYAAYAWDGKEWQDWYEEYDKLPANTFTHWHHRPAAPQQEVK